MPKINIDNYLGGISLSDRMGRPNSFFIGKSVNIFNPSHLGYLCSGPESTLISNTITEVISRSVIDPDLNKVYFGDTGGTLNELQVANDRLTRGTVFPYRIPDMGGNHNTHVGPRTIHDCIIYNIGSSPDELFYSWQDNTDGDVGRYNIGAGTFDDDFFSTSSGGGTLTRLCPHIMLSWGESGRLYIADGEKLHYYDGENNLSKKNALSLPHGWHITALFDAGEFIGICTKFTTDNHILLDSVFNGKSRVFFWDGVSSTFNKMVPEEDPQIRGAYSLNNELYIITLNNSKKGAIKRFNGNRFVLETEIENNVSGESSKHYLSSQGAVNMYKDIMLLGTKNHGNLFAYGSLDGSSPKALSNPISFATTSSQISAPIAVSNDVIYFAAKTGTSFSYRKAVLTNSDSNRMVFKSLYYEFPQRAKINYVKLCFKALASGQGDDILLDLDYGKRQIHAGNISFAGDGARTEKRLGVRENCNNFRLIIQPDEGPGIKYGEIVVDFDLLSGDAK